MTKIISRNAYSWFAKLVVAGELLIGLAMIVGAFVGIAAVFGAFMNWNFMLEVIWAIVYWLRPSRMLAQIGVILAVSLITLWAITRIAPRSIHQRGGGGRLLRRVY